MVSFAPLALLRRWPGKTASERLRPAVAALVLLLQPAGAVAQAKPSEYDVKAAYLLNFGRFMRISGESVPQPPSFDICILGRDPMGQSMDELAANESIEGRPVRVLRIGDATEARGCAILYISALEDDEIREDLAILDGADVLTVSDAASFIERGGMIQFVLEGDHVRFEVNLDAVDRTHLVLSSELLRVASLVKGAPAEEHR